VTEESPTNRRTGRFSRQVQVEGDKEEDNSWLLVYLDVITLLLIVFVILLAMIEPEDDEHASGEGIFDGQEHILEGDPSVLEGMPEIRDDTDSTLVLPTELEERGVEATGEEDTITFRLDDAVLFETAQAELQPEGQAAIDELIPIFQATTARISVEGHTDSLPIATEQFPSNWELSSARASAVLRYLAEQGLDPRRLRAIGYGDIRPIDDNETAEGRARNRRVEIVLHFGDTPPDLEGVETP